MLTARWHTVDARAMGSTMRIVVNGGDAALAHDLAAEVARLEQLWSRFVPTSDICRCNRSAGTGPVDVAPETARAIAEAIALHGETGGRFDPTVLRALVANGYDATFDTVRARGDRLHLRAAPPDREPLTIDLSAAPEPAPGCAGIAVDLAAATVSLPAGVHLDLGGIGKGLAADRVAELAMARGADGVCASLGGDIRVAGIGPDDDGWEIAIDDPRDPSVNVARHRLDDGALVMSTSAIRRWRHGGRWRHHLIDPASGLPADSGLVAVAVAAPTAGRAEALAKAAFVAGADRGARLLADRGVRAWMVEA